MSSAVVATVITLIIISFVSSLARKKLVLRVRGIVCSYLPGDSITEVVEVAKESGFGNFVLTWGEGHQRLYCEVVAVQVHSHNSAAQVIISLKGEGHFWSAVDEGLPVGSWLEIVRQLDEAGLMETNWRWKALVSLWKARRQCRRERTRVPYAVLWRFWKLTKAGA